MGLIPNLDKHHRCYNCYCRYKDFGMKGERRMTVSEKIKELTNIIDALEEKYCENCQLYGCDVCPYLMEEDNRWV